MIYLFFLSFVFVSLRDYNYIPSSFFVFPVFVSTILNRRLSSNILLAFSSLLFVILSAPLISQSLSFYSWPYIKSLLLLFSIVLSCFIAERYIFSFLDPSKIPFPLIRPQIFSIFIVLAFSPFIAYEPSSLGRLWPSLFSLLYLIPFSIGISKEYFIRLTPIHIAMFIALVYSLSPPSLTLFSLLVISVILSSFILLIRAIPFLFKATRFQFSAVINKRNFSIIFLCLLFLCLAFLFLEERRINNLSTLLTSIRTVSFDDFVVLGGGRFLSTSEGYKAFIASPFQFSAIGFDLPSITSSSEYYINLRSYSGLVDEFLLSRRPHSLLAWFAFNYRFLFYPFLIYSIYMLFSICRYGLKISDNLRCFSFFLALSISLYLLFLAAPPSLPHPVFIFYCLFLVSKRQSSLSTSP